MYRYQTAAADWHEPLDLLGDYDGRSHRPGTGPSAFSSHSHFSAAFQGRPTHIGLDHRQSRTAATILCSSCAPLRLAAIWGP